MRQEVENARLFAVRPSLDANPALPRSLSGLPEPDTLLRELSAGSCDSAAVLGVAEASCRHRFQLLGYEIETGPEIRWRRDYIHHVEGGLAYFRRIPYLNAKKAGDHKIIWELNRHQHLVVLAHAWRLTGRREFLDEIPLQIESWWEQNPFMRGINWASALEVAFRVLSWIEVYHLAGSHLADGFRRRLAAGIFRHGIYLENNLSVYFSRIRTFWGRRWRCMRQAPYFRNFPAPRSGGRLEAISFRPR